MLLCYAQIPDHNDKSHSHLLVTLYVKNPALILVIEMLDDFIAYVLAHVFV